MNRQAQTATLVALRAAIHPTDSDVPAHEAIPRCHGAIDALETVGFITPREARELHDIVEAGRGEVTHKAGLHEYIRRQVTVAPAV